MGLIAANNNGVQSFAPGSAPVKNEANELLRRVGIVALVAIACMMAVAASAVSLVAIFTVNPLLVSVGVSLFVVPIAVLATAGELYNIW